MLTIKSINKKSRNTNKVKIKVDSAPLPLKQTTGKNVYINKIDSQVSVCVCVTTNQIKNRFSLQFSPFQSKNVYHYEKNVIKLLEQTVKLYFFKKNLVENSNSMDKKVSIQRKVMLR